MTPREDTSIWPQPTLLRALGRGLRRRCPRCGARGIFRRWFSILDACRTCDLRFEREQGYWTGAMMIDIAVTETIFLAVFIGGMIVTWPEVPWSLLLVVVVAINVIVPVFFYPIAQTTWIALERHFRAIAERGG